MRLVRRALMIALGLWAASAAAAAENNSAESPETVRGTLKRVRLRDPGASGPIYVLMGKHDDVLCRVTPPKGLDVQPYLGRRVRVSGKLDLAPGKTPRIAARELADDAAPRDVTQVSHEAEMVEQEEIPLRAEPDPISSMSEETGDPTFDLEVAGHPDGCSCDTCAPDSCRDPWCGGCRLGGPLRWLGIQRCDHAAGPDCGLPGLYWARADFLLWFMRGMDLPPLVTASPLGTPRAQTGVLGQPGTTVLFGGNSIHDDSTSGGRIQFGTWLNRDGTFGAEGEYLALAEENTSFAADERSFPQLGRPFFNSLTNRQDAELVAFPNLLDGSVLVDVSTQFQSAGVRFLHTRWCSQRECTDACNHCGGVHIGQRLNFLAGYRFLRLDDSVQVTEDLASTTGTAPGTTLFFIQDRFHTRNEFHGGEIGLAWDVYRNRWSLECLAKVAFGNTYQDVRISGNTQIEEDGQVQAFNGGLLTQRTNIGDFSRERFSVVPEVNLNIGYRWTRRLWTRVGYSFIFWSRVARAGSQIDTSVNPNLLPPEAVPFSGPLRPEFAFHDTGFWAQGVNFGLDYRW